jgi:hypothetical protein
LSHVSKASPDTTVMEFPPSPRIPQFLFWGWPLSRLSSGKPQSLDLPLSHSWEGVMRE